ncbi:BnaUnng03600D, partial [Brassica napus]
YYTTLIIACLNPKRKNQLWEAGKCATCQAGIRRLSILSRRPCYGKIFFTTSWSTCTYNLSPLSSLGSSPPSRLVVKFSLRADRFFTHNKIEEIHWCMLGPEF